MLLAGAGLMLQSLARLQSAPLGFETEGIVTMRVAPSGERYADVIVFWVPSEGDKLALVQDESTPFFTTPHFDGHLSVLLRASRVGEISYEELADQLTDVLWSGFQHARLAPAPTVDAR